MAGSESPTVQAEASANQRLDSWKEIAVYLKRDVRTVRRWEKQEGLPVHRHVHKKVATVYAYKVEIDAWWRDGRPRVEQKEHQEKAKALTRRRALWWSIAAAALALVAFLLVQVGHRPAIQSVAILPFTNLSGDQAQEYFVDGMTDALITDLAKMGGLSVVSRASVMPFKGRLYSAPEIARRLKVDAVVEGTVARSGNRVRITAQLIDGRTDRHLWAESYERNVSDILVLQSEVAAAIARECLAKLAPQAARHPPSARPVNPDAYEAYLKGRFFLNKRTAQSMQESVDYFERAIQADPNYAAAYAGLADVYQLLGYYQGIPKREAYFKAKQAATRALVLDDTLAEAHTSLAAIKCDFEWDWAGAEGEYRRALALNPSYATAYHWYAELLAGLGRFEEALGAIQRAQRLDPLSPVITVTTGQMYARLRQYDKAMEEHRKALEIEPAFYQAHDALARLYIELGNYDQALAEMRKTLAASPGPGDVGPAEVYLARLYAASGKRPETLKAIETMKRLAKPHQELEYRTASLYALLGDKDQAFELLEKAYGQHSADLVYLRSDPEFNRLRGDPRYDDLLRRMGLSR